MQPGGGLLQLSPSARGAAVAPGGAATYVWAVPASAGPGPADFSTVAYIYRSTVALTAHQNAGLVGAVVISRPVRASPAAPL
jgi:hephaestin